MQPRTRRIIVGFTLVALFAAHCAGHITLPLIDRLEAIAYDARVRLAARPGIDPNIVIVDVDEKSLAAEGRWPWPRDRLAALLDELFSHYNVRLAGFDMVFPEPDRDAGVDRIKALLKQEKSLPAGLERHLIARAGVFDHDLRFARSMDQRPVILGYYFSARNATETASDSRLKTQPDAGALPAPVLSDRDFAGTDSRLTAWGGYGANLPVLAKHARSAGHFNYSPDMDGISRRVPLLARYNGQYYEALSLAMVRELIGAERVRLITGKSSGGYARVEQVALDDVINVPVDENLNALVPFRAGAGAFTYVSAVDVLQRTLPKTVMEDRIVLIGTTAPGLVDLRATPVSTMLPGVEVHANLVSGMLDSAIRSVPPYVAGIEILCVVTAGLLLTLLLPRANPVQATVLAGGTLLVVGAANLALWEAYALVTPIASAALLILVLYGFNMMLGYLEETRARKQITSLFGHYVPPDLVREMSKDPEHFTLEGESREMSVLFSDVRGFTTISEGMEPRELVRLMNQFLTPLTRVVYDHRGTIDKYIGDCIMAFWGAPIASPAHAAAAVRAALDMVRAMEALKPQLRAQGWPELAVGIGINSGRMSVGNMGSEIRVAYTVMGDAVNLASRLEGITKQYGVSIIVGQDTRAQVQGVVFREIDRVQVKGKSQPITIYEPLGLEEGFATRSREELAIWHEALAAYRAQDWTAATQLLAQLIQRTPDSKLYQVYLERISHFRMQPPINSWDGVFAFETK